MRRRKYLRVRQQRQTSYPIGRDLYTRYSYPFYIDSSQPVRRSVTYKQIHAPYRARSTLLRYPLRAKRAFNRAYRLSSYAFLANHPLHYRNLSKVLKKSKCQRAKAVRRSVFFKSGNGSGGKHKRQHQRCKK